MNWLILRNLFHDDPSSVVLARKYVQRITGPWYRHPTGLLDFYHHLLFVFHHFSSLGGGGGYLVIRLFGLSFELGALCIRAVVVNAISWIYLLLYKYVHQLVVLSKPAGDLTLLYQSFPNGHDESKGEQTKVPYCHHKLGTINQWLPRKSSCWSFLLGKLVTSFSPSALLWSRMPYFAYSTIALVVTPYDQTN